MGMNDEIQLLEEYNQWKSVKRAESADISPQAFYVERMKEAALERLNNILDYVQANQMPPSVRRTIEGIANGTITGREDTGTTPGNDAIGEARPQSRPADALLDRDEIELLDYDYDAEPPY